MSVFGTPTPVPHGGGPCPCGTGRVYPECCGALHTGRRDAATAEELMRSRYSAFAVGDEAYLLRSWHPRTRPEGLRLDPAHRWVGLDVRSREAGTAGDDHGVVTYSARSRRGLAPEQTLTERARFERRAGRWVYVDGDILD